MEYTQNMFPSRRDRYYDNDNYRDGGYRRRPRGRGGRFPRNREDDREQQEQQEEPQQTEEQTEENPRGRFREQRRPDGKFRPFKGGRGISFQRHSANVINKINSKIETAADQKDKPDNINGIMFFSSKRATNKFGEPLDYYLMPFVGYVKIVDDDLATELKKQIGLDNIANDVVFGRDELNEYEHRRSENQ